MSLRGGGEGEDVAGMFLSSFFVLRCKFVQQTTRVL